MLILLLTIFLVFLNGYFVAAEFALVKVRGSQLEPSAKKGSKSAILALSILKNLDPYLSACQIGITLTSLALGAVGEPFIEHILESTLAQFQFSETLIKTFSYTIALISLTILHVVFGEQVPKIMALQRPKQTSMLVVYPLHIFFLVFKYAVLSLNWISNKTLVMFGFHAGSHDENHTAEELELLIDKGKETGVLVKHEHEIIKNVFGFDKITARHVMKDKPHISSIDIKTDITEVMAKVIKEGYSRIPVYKDNIDNITGILYTKDLIRLVNNKSDAGQTIKLTDAIRPAHFVHENKKVSHILRDLQLQKSHMSIVVNEYGSVVGLLTIEDIIEEIVGEIEDEHDDESPIVQLVDDEYIVNATATIEDVNEHLPLPLPLGDYETVGGYLIEISTTLPKVNDLIKTDEYTFTIIKKINQGIQTVKLKKN